MSYLLAIALIMLGRKLKLLPRMGLSGHCCVKHLLHTCQVHPKHSSSKYLLSTYSAPELIPDTEDIAVNKIDKGYLPGNENKKPINKKK